MLFVMRGWGIFFMVFAVANFIMFIISPFCGNEEMTGKYFSATLMLGILGVYLIHCAKRRKNENEERDKWNKD